MKLLPTLDVKCPFKQIKQHKPVSIVRNVAEAKDGKPFMILVKHFYFLLHKNDTTAPF